MNSHGQFLQRKSGGLPAAVIVGMLCVIALSTGCASRPLKATGMLDRSIERIEHRAGVGSVEVPELAIDTLGERLHQGGLSCRAVIASVLEHVKRLDRGGSGGLHLNALITSNPDALGQADALDAQREASTGLAPAHCLPVVVKDNIDTVQMPTTGGSPLFAGWHPRRDAVVVERLRQAGAIIVAKANLDDFAASVYGVSTIGGATRNPYAPALTVGGSSGGSAAAVAAGYVPLAIGTDAGGSLRIPASFTGTVTIRPTVGLVSMDGIMPRSGSQDTAGPIARSVQDAAFGLDLIADGPPGEGRPRTSNMTNSDGPSANGTSGPPVPPKTAAVTAPHPPSARTGARSSYASHALGASLRGARIGIVYEGLALFGGMDRGVRGLLDRAAADMSAAGAEVVPVDPPDRRLLADSSVITYEARRDMDGYLAAAGSAAPVRNFAALVHSGAFTPQARASLERERAVDPASLDTDPGYRRALASRRALADWTLSMMSAYRLDAVAYASTTRPPRPIGTEQDGVFTRWSENTGFPAIAVPMGLAPSADDPGGPRLPANIEWLGRPYDERRLIEIGAAYEQATHRREAPALR